MKYEGTPVKAPPATRKRMMPPTPQRGSHPLTEEMQWQAETEAQGSIWSARERTVITKMENYLDGSDDMKLDVGELELLMGQEDSEVDLRYILAHARRRCSRIFEIFRTREKSDQVASRNRWLEYQGQTVAQQERSQSDQCWTEACEGLAKRMLKCLEDSDIPEVSTGTSPVSKRTKDQCRAHRKGKPGTRRKTSYFKSSGKEKVRSSSPVRRDGMLN